MGFRDWRCLFSSLLRHPIFFVTLPLLLLTYYDRVITTKTRVIIIVHIYVFGSLYFIFGQLENVYHRFSSADKPASWADPASRMRNGKIIHGEYGWIYS